MSQLMSQPTKSNQRELRYLPIRELRVATDADGTRKVSGYAALFNSRSVDFGGWCEIIAPSAFTTTLQEQPDVLALRDHDPSILLGRTKSGTLTLTVDATGLRFDLTLPDTTQARDLAESMSRGDIDSCSFGFCTDNDVWAEDAEGCTVRTLLAVTLFEISIVSFPAYPDTSASLRSCPVEIRSRIETPVAQPPTAAEPEPETPAFDLRIALAQRTRS
jgi:HK97 family phage prohead protease